MSSSRQGAAESDSRGLLVLGHGPYSANDYTTVIPFAHVFAGVLFGLAWEMTEPGGGNRMRM